MPKKRSKKDDLKSMILSKPTVFTLLLILGMIFFVLMILVGFGVGLFYYLEKDDQARNAAKSICSYSGVTYDNGAFFDSVDGCNTCTCNDGLVSCTEMDCIDEEPAVQPSIKFFLNRDESSYASSLDINGEGGTLSRLDFQNLFGRKFLIDLPEIIAYETNIFFYFKILPMGCSDGADTACIQTMNKVSEDYLTLGGIWELDMDSGLFEHIYSFEQYRNTNTSVVSVDNVTAVGEGQYLIDIKYHQYNPYNSDQNEVIITLVLDTEDGVVVESD
ncbi:MAG: hypothetical protein PHS44_06015 [Candidatus Dojkabacteria bacterium]|jgi:hypothetical protein|nr:hypothetical protein [Candidatus Dojkabacteria bacterium]